MGRWGALGSSRQPRSRDRFPAGRVNANPPVMTQEVCCEEADEDDKRKRRPGSRLVQQVNGGASAACDPTCTLLPAARGKAQAAIFHPFISTRWRLSF